MKTKKYQLRNHHKAKTSTNAKSNQNKKENQKNLLKPPFRVTHTDFQSPRHWCSGHSGAFVGAFGHISSQNRHQQIVIGGHHIDLNALESARNIQFGNFFVPSGRQITFNDQCEWCGIQNVHDILQTGVNSSTIARVYKIGFGNFHIFQFQFHFI